MGPGALLDVTCLEHFPNLDYFAGKSGRSAMIIDDRHLADLSVNPKHEILAMGFDPKSTN